MKNLLIGSRGIALTVVIFVVAVLLTLTGASLLFSGLALKITGALKVGTIAFQVADSGIQHTLAVIPAGTTFPYSSTTEVVPSTPHPAIAGFSYSVTAVNTAGETQAILTSTARGPNDTTKVVVAYVGRGGFGLGATSLPGSTAQGTETNFSGTSFSIDGNDNCNAAPPVPGIVVTDSPLATEITNSTTSDGGLAANQTSLVTGAGSAPSVATIKPLGQSVSQIADRYLSLSHVELPPANYGGNDNWGTTDTPRITWIKPTEENAGATISGNITGYGVLIVDGPLEVTGSFVFHGLVIARGDVQVQVNGNAGIYGSLLIGESTDEDADAGYELDVRGNAHIRFDSCALSPADSWVPLPKKARLLAWQERLTN